MLSQNKASVPENLISLAKKTSQIPVGIVSAHQAAAMESAKQAFELNLITPIFKIIFSTILTSIIFYFLIIFFENNLSYESEFKLLTIIMLVIVTFIVYIIISILTKAFKISDIKLKY